MKAAVIGGGFAGRTHVLALRAAGVEPYLVITTKKETAERFAKEMGIPHWSGADEDRYSKAFAPEIDAVHICTPPTSHARIVRELLAHGKNVLCEKPIALDLEEAEALARISVSSMPVPEAHQKTGQNNFPQMHEQKDSAENRFPLCALTFNVRYHLACQRAKEIIQSGAFGKPILIHGSYLQEFHALPAPYDWRYDPKTGGKMRAVTEIGSHWIDLAQYLTGTKVTAVSAMTANYWPERQMENGLMSLPKPDLCGGEANQNGENKETLKEENPADQKISVISEDAAAVHLRFDNGAIGNVMLSEVSPGRGNYLSFEITCENGNLWWNEEDNNVLYTAQKGKGIHVERFAFGNGFGDTFEELLRRFYAAVKTGKETDLPTFEEGLQVAEVCSAIGESAGKDGAWVRI